MTDNFEFDDRPQILELLRRAGNGASGRGITALGLQNFQVITSPTFIPFAPITLLYGPNSGGKSSIGDAMTFLSSCATSDSRWKAQSMLTRWANFNRLSRERENQLFVRQPSSVGFWVVVGPGEYDWHWEYGETANVIDLDTYQGPLRALLWNRAIAVRWVMDLGDVRPPGPICAANFAIWAGADCLDPLLEIHGEQHSAKTPTRWASVCLNRTHPLFAELNEQWDQAAPSGAPLKTRPESEPYSDTDKWFELNAFDWSAVNPSEFGIIDSPFPDDGSAKEQLQFLAKYAADSLRIIARLCRFASVPPIRSVPTRAESTFVLIPDDPISQLSNIIARREVEDDDPWRVLARDAVGLGHRYNEEGVFAFVSRLIRDESLLGLGYRLNARTFSFGPGRQNSHTTGPTPAHPNDVGYITHLNLLDEQNNEVEIEDVGTGVSQLLPVLVALYENQNLIVHQPELHLHPRLQSVLGDLLLLRRSRTSVCTIVESHSEHLLLRILRRIRETPQDVGKRMPYEVDANDLVVLYFDKSDDGGTEIKHLRIDKSGDFLDRWPHGFFTERDEDLDAFAV